MAEYKDILTLDGLVRPQPGVSKRKLEATADLLGRALKGDYQAEGVFKEAMTTSDLRFNAAHLVSAETIAQFPEMERTWTEVAGVRTVPSFNAVQLQSLFGDVEGAGIREGGGAARVPEAAPYPHVTITGQEAFYAKINKNGFRFAYTWESRVNDVAGFFDQLPSELLQVAGDTEEAEVYDALIEGTAQAGASVQLDGGTLPDGSIVTPNAKVSPEAIWQAVLESSNRTVNGRKVGRMSAYRVIVPTGQAMFLEWKLSQAVLAIQDGNITYGPGDRSVFGSIQIVESDKIGLTNPDEWYLIPAPGAYRRPFLELGRLRGYELPELRVANAAGNYLGGGVVSPFEGSFDADTIDYRFRYVCGGILWTTDPIVYSDGSES